MSCQPGHISPVHKGSLRAVFRATSTSFGDGQCPKLQQNVEKRILIVMEGSVLLFKNRNSGRMRGHPLQVKVSRCKLSWSIHFAWGLLVVKDIV